MTHRRTFLSLFMLACVHAGSTAAAVDPKQVSQLRKMRSLAEDSASLIKGKFSDISVVYIESRRRYMIARSEIEGLLGYIKQSLLNGSLSTAESNSYLKDACASAEKHARSYFDYVAKNLPEAVPKPGVAGLLALGEATKLVVDILQGWGAAKEIDVQITEARQKQAADLEKDLRWLTWAEVSEAKAVRSSH